MAKFVKDVIKPGVYNKHGLDVVVSQDHIDQWVRNFNEMRDRKLKVPVPWEHPDKTDDSAWPVDGNDMRRVRNRERARLNAGWVENLYQDDDGILKVEIDIPREEDASRLKDVGGYVSPQFGRWKEYDNAITHMALTPHPVNTDQTDVFEPVDDTKQFSIAELVFEHPIQMSLADYSDSETTQLGCDDMDYPGDKTTQMDTTPETSETPQPQPKPEMDEGNVKEVQRLKHSLMAHGIEVNDEIASDPECLHDLLQAVLNHHDSKRDEKKMEEKNDKKEERSMTPEENETSTTDAPIEEERTVVTMSDTDLQQQLSDLTATVQEKNAQISGLLQANERLIQEQTKEKRAKYESRIDACLQKGQCSPTQAEKLREIAGTYQFSDHSEGFDALDIRLEVMEELREGAVLEPQQQIQQFSVAEERKNSFFTGGNLDETMSDEDVDAAVNEQLKMVGGILK